ncbi:membrane-associated tyrosine- and threonine-specific cdc2-inhibitory kinase isoform X3 [Rhinoderma darwinii]|uniref:membrane-associated tyrosine- and threonine-specific cdc2-inhibitory kinase isoform X3 n=1 Tax=Rhinoderma darwinii TaxID=43563 RepID=UPI003F67C3F0
MVRSPSEDSWFLVGGGVMPLPGDEMGDSLMTRTPIPVPEHFSQAEQSFSHKKRGRALCYTLPPRPPVKSIPPISRIFPNKQRSWSLPRPQSVSFRSPQHKQPVSRLYDHSKEETFYKQCFQTLCKLGRGSFGEVYKVRSREDGAVYAVKRSVSPFRGESDRLRKLQELGDFGLMVELDGAEGSGEAQEGDPRYMAPELLDGVFTKAADVFSLGMTLLEVACNMELPKGGEGWQQLRQGRLPTEFTSELPTDFLKVLCGMLEPNYRCRVTVDWLLCLPVIHRAERWRRMTLTTRRVLTKILTIFQFLLWLVTLVVHVLRRPVMRLLHWKSSASLNSPPSSPSPNYCLESSFSSDWEDESLGDDVFEVPPSPLCYPRNITYHGEEFPLSSRHSPDLLPRPSLGSTSTPCNMSPKYNLRQRSTRTPNVSRISQDSPCSVKSVSPDGSGSSGFVDAEAPRSSFLPRNLLNIFDEVSEH